VDKILLELEGRTFSVSVGEDGKIISAQCCRSGEELESENPIRDQLTELLRDMKECIPIDEEAAFVNRNDKKMSRKYKNE